MKASVALLLTLAGLLGAFAAQAQMEIESGSMHVENAESVFEHDVVVTGEGIVITSDEIRVARDGGAMTARGNPVVLVVERPTATIRVQAATIVYQPEDEVALLPAGGQITGREVTVTAGQISVDLAAGSVQARTAVRILAADSEARGEQLDLAADGSLQMRGMPATLQMTIDGDSASGQAQLIRLAGDGRQLYMQGSAQSVYKGETIVAEKITYNLATGELATEAAPGERVRVVIDAP
ncbi:MAG: hypothetical protein OXC81_05375 [Betaproteobacteria bacterium]|nr:hypothetical protein [Betaproteobacteria bacterium]